jgi:hypothetical protein
MDLPKFILALLLLAFTAFLFPEMNEAIDAISVSEALKPLFQIVPYIFLGVEISGAIHYGVEKD